MEGELKARVRVKSEVASDVEGRAVGVRIDEEDDLERATDGGSAS